MGFEEIWDKILEELEYIYTFEWIGDIGEFFTGFFENIGELSIPGLIYGVILVILVYMFRNSVFVLVPNFLVRLIFYIVAFVMGYLTGRRLWD